MEERGADAFFRVMDLQELDVTFDDVLVRPGYCGHQLSDIDLESRFSTNTRVKRPFVSAAMDTVTERKMAIALASMGALGIIHYNFDPEGQAAEVLAVKKHLNARIENPVTVHFNETVQQVLARIKAERYNFRSFPVLNNDQKIAGIITGNNFDRCSDPSMKVSEIMSKAVVTGNPNTTQMEAFELLKQQPFQSLPLVTADGKVVGMYVLSDLMRIRDKTSLHNTDDKGRLMVGAAVSTGAYGLDRAKLLVAAGVDVIVIDSAHGDTKSVMDTFEMIKQETPHTDVVVGNISQYEAAQRLVAAGVDGIKVGQGGGSICLTQVMTGAGSPQLSAVYHCVLAVRESGKDIPVCSDGAVRYPGDVTRAIAAGADSVMMGKMFAGSDEAPGETSPYRGGLVKGYRGMGSRAAMAESAGSRARYGEVQVEKDLILAEGVDGNVAYTGPVEQQLHKLSEGLRRGMGLAGMLNIRELQEKGRFRRRTSEGIKESHPHDLVASEAY